MDLLREFEKQQIKDTDRPRLKPGDFLSVETKVVEGDKTRLQKFEGTLIGIRGSGPSTMFTVRRETGKFGVERVFPLYSPLVTNIEIVKRQKVRRAKLNYLRHAGRRRVKEDELAMQRHVQEEGDKKRLVEEAKKREEDRKAKEESAQRRAEEAKKKEEEAAQASQTEEKSDKEKE